MQLNPSAVPVPRSFPAKGQMGRGGLHRAAMRLLGGGGGKKCEGSCKERSRGERRSLSTEFGWCLHSAGGVDAGRSPVSQV